jgi:DNA-binding GntR family transcriptional regulator
MDGNVTGIRRVLLREEIEDLLLGRILSGHYSPGDRLVETRIAQELGTSQAPVREALRDLTQLRLVETVPFRGARVREIALEEILEGYPVRSALEEFAAREAATKLKGDVSALEREFDQMRAAAAKGDVSAQFAHDAAFHRQIVEAAGNKMLLAVWDSLGIHARTAITFMKSGMSSSEVLDLHRPILEALREQDGEQAAVSLHRHFTTFAELLRQQATANDGPRVAQSARRSRAAS